MSGPGHRSGRSSGSPDTRAEILGAARAAFARGGLAGTTVRSVAETAGVDSALVHHYFGTKQELYLAALAIPADPEFVRAPLRDAPLDDAARALLGAILTLWDGPLRDVASRSSAPTSATTVTRDRARLPGGDRTRRADRPHGPVPYSAMNTVSVHDELRFPFQERCSIRG